ncbi:MAG: hypothetical protein ACRC6I_18220 [Paracoccaceae bacterium]
MTIALCLAVSAHVALPGDWNEVHPCVRLQEDIFIAGAFLNSEDRISAYAGVELRSDNLFLELGAVTGYSGAEVLPFLRAGVITDKDVRIFVSPAYANGDIGAVLGVEFNLLKGN